MYNILGEQVWFKHIETLEQSTINIDLGDSRFANGLYYLNLTADGVSVGKQIVLVEITLSIFGIDAQIHPGSHYVDRGAFIGEKAGNQERPRHFNTRFWIAPAKEKKQNGSN
ncbi:MAG: hypothetical protein H6571_04815 [Lewinellaceae bacterium]|nr:hypothetical protein [Lewinellaceae bacterium]